MISRWLLAFVLAVCCSSMADAMDTWRGTRTQPGSIYRHGPNGMPFNIDTGRYVRFEPTGTGGARAVAEYPARVGHPPARTPVFIGKAPLSAITLGRAATGLARFAGPAGLAVTLVDLVWDASDHIWRYPDEPGETQWEAFAVCPNQSLIGISATPGPSCLAGMFAYDAGSCVINTVVFAAGATTFKYGPNCSGWSGSNFSGEAALRYRCKDGSPSGWFNYTRGQAAPTNCGSPADPTAGAPASDEDIAEAIAEGLQNTPSAADDVASDASARPDGEDVIADEIGDPVASGPGSVPSSTGTTTTTGPAGQTTTNTTTNFNFNYVTNNVYLTVTTITTTTAPNGDETTETEEEGGPPDEPPEDSKPEEKSDLCKDNPDASACATLDEIEEPELVEQDKTVSLSPSMTGAGSCPAPRTATIHTGQSVVMSYQPFCDVATGVRPIVIGLAWLAAGIWLFYIARGSQ